MLWALLAGIAIQEEPRIDVGLRIEHLWVYRSRPFEEAAAALSAAPAPAGTREVIFPYGRADLRFTSGWSTGLRGVIHVANLTRVTFGNVPLAIWPAMRLEAAYIDIPFLPANKGFFRIGAQPYAFQNRPPGLEEPFYLDLSNAHSPYEGATTDIDGTILRLRERAFRTRGVPYGVRMTVGPIPWVAGEIFAFRLDPNVRRTLQEELVGAVVQVALGERASIFTLGTVNFGVGPDAVVGTGGLGGDVYLNKDRTTELFGEIYGQVGRLSTARRKRGAWAIRAGARQWIGPWWAEISAAHRSGDRRVGDGIDSTFQAYGNLRQFLVVQDAEFGLAWQSNLRWFAVSVGHASPSHASRWHARVDLGFLRADARPMPGVSPRLGVEVDATLSYRAQDSLWFHLRAGWLTRSRTLRDLGPSRRTSAFVVTFGPELVY